ncbi:MAG TPA: MobF family relaxase, partial [Solirubrobacteraceae bacterium]
MLSIGKIAQGQHRYYERQVARGEDDYYSGRGEAPGEWTGAGARALGLAGRVSAEQFNALIAGRDPRHTGSRLRSMPGDPKVAAFDLTFSAPKSVSVLFAIAPAGVSGALAACHEEAVRSALGFLEDEAVKVRRGRAGERVEKGEGLIAAAYRHRMSRALDPQLHTHVVAANLACGPDGRFTALHSAELYRAAKTAGFLYQAHLRALVRERLRLEWGPVRNGAGELAGVARAVVEFFSKRRQEMQRAAAEGGIGLGSKSAAEHAALATRERKQYGVETHTWREEVQACAAEQGLGTDEVARLLQAGQERASQAMTGCREVDEQTLGDHLAGASGLTERSNTFDTRMVLQEFAAAAQAGALVNEVRGMAARFTAREDVIATARGEMTTTELVGVERRLIAAVMGRAHEDCGVVGDQLTERVIAGADRELTAEQARVVRAVAGSGHGVSVIEALAGTGKTYTAGVLREVYEAAGMEVVGVGPTGRAARELSEEAGIPARTLDRLLGELERFDQALPQGCVVILDEAGMAATRASAQLLEAAETAGAKLVAIGDPGQLASVQAGGWLGAVGRQFGAVRLTEVMRQRDPAERRALAALHDRQPAPYLDWAERAGRIETFEESQGARKQALAEWTTAAAKVGPAQAVMITRENDMRDALNRAARELRRAQGDLGEERDYGGIRVAVGDRVICRRNDRMVDVDNGMRGTVRHVDPARVVIDTDGGLVRELPAGYVQEHVEHAYALTGHGMQGGTVQTAIVLASPHDLSAGWSYTALSRARGETRLLVYEDKLDQERAGFAPSEQTEKASRAGLIARVEHRMSERDDEDLAIEQLPVPSEEHAGAGRAADPNLATARALQHEPHQEHAATRAEPNQPPPPTPARLRELRERIKELQAQLHALTPDHGEHPEARAERDGLAQALGEAARERTEILDQLTEREQQAPSQWVKTALGERREEPRPREAWEKAVRAATSYRSQ